MLCQSLYYQPETGVPTCQESIVTASQES